MMFVTCWLMLVVVLFIVCTLPCTVFAFALWFDIAIRNT